MNDFFEYLLSRYPLSRPQDVVKTLYQCFYGAGHAVDNLAAKARIEEEISLCPEASRTENLINGYCRYHLGREDNTRALALSILFAKGASFPPTEGFNEALENFRAFPFRSFTQEEKEAFLAFYDAHGRPILSHSDEYKAAYGPHYRVLPERCARLVRPLADILLLPKTKPIVIAIDGRCGSGKTTLADLLAELLGASVIRCDDFFIPKADRGTPSEINLDYQRFRHEVALPLSAGNAPVYRRYDCHLDTFSPCSCPPSPYYIVEGSYSTAPQLTKYYDYALFCDVAPNEQQKRLLVREGVNGWKIFRDKWIPLEEDYLSKYDIARRCDVLI